MTNSTMSSPLSRACSWTHSRQCCSAWMMFGQARGVMRVITGVPPVSGRTALLLRGCLTERVLVRMVEAGSGVGSAALGVTVLVGLKQAIRVNDFAGSTGMPQPFTSGALDPLLSLSAVVTGAGCIHAAVRVRAALVALILASATLVVGFAGVELFPATDPAVSMGAVGLAIAHREPGVRWPAPTSPGPIPVGRAGGHILTSPSTHVQAKDPPVPLRLWVIV